MIWRMIVSSVLKTKLDAFEPPPSPKKPSIFHQSELNDLVRDLNLLKDASELLASRQELAPS